MSADTLLEAPSSDGPFESILNGTGAHGFVSLHHGRAHSLLFAEFMGALASPPPATKSGKEELGVAMGRPPMAQALDHGSGDRNKAILATLTIADEESSGLGVNVRHVDSKRFREAQTASVDEREIGMEPRLSDLAKQESDFLSIEDDGKLFPLSDNNFIKDRPSRIDLEMVTIESAQRDLGQLHGAGFVLLVLAKKDEVIADLILRERVGISLEMLTDQANMRDVRVLSANPKISKLDEVSECC